MRRILIITLLLLPGIYAAAQQFPVQVTPQLLPPYTLQVSEYYSPGAAGAKLNLLLLLRDFNKPTLQVRLRMSIEGQSVVVRSREDAVFSTITIESGVPKYVQPSELEQYFNSNNLEFSGMTRQQYEQTGKLPEGFYSFCFEVVEAGTNLVVSNKGCGMAWLTLNEPPLLNIPRKAEEIIPPQNPGQQQNILFQWTPRHMASPTAGYNTEYKFYLTELPDNAIAPEAAFLSYEAIDSATVTTTTFLYDHTRTALLEGKRYAWRVQAIAKEGLQNLAMFRNNGFSETFWFTYQNTCALPTSIDANPQGQRVTITWDNNVSHIEYKVEYREKNNANAVWFDIGNTIPRVSLGDLKHSTTYEYRVGAACEFGKFIFAPLEEFTTNDSLSTTIIACGIDPNILATTEPLMEQMNVGDTIRAGDFNIITTKVVGQNSFSGEGYVAVSWLANAKIAVRFTNIGVAVDKKLKTGVIETTYDPSEGGLLDVDDFVKEVKDFVNLISELLAIDIDDRYNNIKGLADKFREQAKSELPDSLHQQIEETYEKLLESKLEYDSLQTALQDCTEPAACESIKDKIEEAKQKFEEAKDEIKQLEDEKKKFLTVYGAIIRDALKAISLESTDSLPSATQSHSSRAQSLGFDLADQLILTDSLITIEIDSADDVTGSIGDFLTSAEQLQYEQYFAAERKLNTTRLAKFFSEKMDTDKGAEKLGIELIKDAKKLCNYIYDALKNNVPRPQIVNEAKGLIYQRINNIYFEQIK
jgi:TANFOR domain-containing protein